MVYCGHLIHFNHKNIAKGTSVWKSGYRDFKNPEEMNEVLLENINDKVGEDDTLYHLGDFAFSSSIETLKWLRARIVCKNIIYILGNHDREIRKNKEGIRGIFSSVQSDLIITVEKQEIILYHYPIASWFNVGRGSWMLFGHCHSKFENRGKSLDVGMDNYFKLFNIHSPFSFEEIEKIMKSKEESTKYNR